MYTIDCEDPNCVKCRQPSEGHSSEEENKKKNLMTVEELVSRDLLLASNKKAFCLEASRKIKEEIHYRISRLICALRERERDLCTQVELECCTQMAQIDHDATVQCVDKLLKRNSEPEKSPCRTKLAFNCELDFILWELKKFGQLSYEDSLEHSNKGLAKESQKLTQQLEKSERTLIENVPLSTTPLDSPLEAVSRPMNNDKIQKMIWILEENILFMENLEPKTNADRLIRLDHLKVFNDLLKCARDIQSNEKLKIISKSSKDEQQYFEGTDSESSKEVGKDTSTIEKFKNLNKSLKDDGRHFEEGTDTVCSKEFGKDTSSDEDDLEIISMSEAAAIPSELPPLPPKNRFRFGRKRSCFPSLYLKKPLLSPETNSAFESPISSKTQSRECMRAFIHHGMCESFNEQASQECLTKSESSIVSDNKDIKKESLTALISLSEKKEIPSFNEQSSQESSSKCTGDSSVEGQGHHPSIALLSSFKKYLEKNPEGEWLVSEKGSEQSLSSGNSCIFNRSMPLLDQWLSTKKNQEMVSDWLYTAQV